MPLESLFTTIGLFTSVFILIVFFFFVSYLVNVAKCFRCAFFFFGHSFLFLVFDSRSFTSFYFFFFFLSCFLRLIVCASWLHDLKHLHHLVELFSALLCTAAFLVFYFIFSKQTQTKNVAISIYTYIHTHIYTYTHICIYVCDSNHYLCMFFLFLLMLLLYLSFYSVRAFPERRKKREKKKKDIVPAHFPKLNNTAGELFF